eukprot:TRINITY_DN74214_c0_g1_i1.p1 TRINITY_DN74214_c0_g1~~TRINITY_DN74214_c0_g1_i1.p1  ORF type:complete len:742 (+),score=125.91 TRINITY_DN74214_c0_g1_i1:103-2226(+)
MMEGNVGMNAPRMWVPRGSVPSAAEEESWASGVYRARNNPRNIQVWMESQGMDDSTMNRWCKWFDVYGGRLAAGRPLCVAQLNFARNQLTSVGVRQLLSLMKWRQVQVSILKLYHNCIEDATDLVDFIEWSEGWLSELHLSHNRLDTTAAHELIVSAVAATDEDGNPRYPQAQMGPLWLRLEQNNIRATALDRQLHPVLDALGRPSCQSVCYIGSKATSQCKPRICFALEFPPAVHVTYLRDDGGKDRHPVLPMPLTMRAPPFWAAPGTAQAVPAEPYLGNGVAGCKRSETPSAAEATHTYLRADADIFVPLIDTEATVWQVSENEAAASAGRAAPCANGKSRSAVREVGKFCSVTKHSAMGCAVVTFSDERVRDAVLREGEQATIMGVSVEIKAHKKAGSELEGPTNVFVAWGRKVERETPISESDLADYFDEKHRRFGFLLDTGGGCRNGGGAGGGGSSTDRYNLEMEEHGGGSSAADFVGDCAQRRGHIAEKTGRWGQSRLAAQKMPAPLPPPGVASEKESATGISKDVESDSDDEDEVVLFMKARASCLAEASASPGTSDGTPMPSVQRPPHLEPCPSSPVGAAPRQGSAEHDGSSAMVAVRGYDAEAEGYVSLTKGERVKVWKETKAPGSGISQWPVYVYGVRQGRADKTGRTRADDEGVGDVGWLPLQAVWDLYFTPEGRAWLYHDVTQKWKWEEELLEPG